MKHICSYCGGEFKRTYSKGHEPKNSFCDIECFKAWKGGVPLEKLKKPTPDEIKFKKMFGRYPSKGELRQYLANKLSTTRGW